MVLRWTEHLSGPFYSKKNLQNGRNPRARDVKRSFNSTRPGFTCAGSSWFVFKWELLHAFLYARIYPESSSFPPQNGSIKTGRRKGKVRMKKRERERDKERERKERNRERERHATEVASVKYMSNRRRIDRGKVISLALRFFFSFFLFLPASWPFLR